MPSVMPHDKGRARALRKLMSVQESDAGGRDAMRKEKLLVKGAVKLSPIYQFRLSDLHYNKANGRIKAEVAELEAQLGRSLEMDEERDREHVRTLLLSIRRDENDKIREDLRRNGQLLPGIVTCDGAIVNGNRRHALLEELHEETHDEKYACLDAHVLPSDITKSEVWLIEAGIQLSAPQQLDYSPINHLLKLREGRDAGLEVAEMAQRIYGIDESRVQQDLSRLDLIDEYLTEYLEKPGRYHLVNGLAEHFIDLQNILERVEKPIGIYREWQPEPSDITELKLVGFYYIRARWPHMRIRDLRNLFCRSAAWAYLRETLKIDPQADVAAPDLEDTGGEMEEDGEPEFEATADSVAFGGRVVETDRRVEKAWQQKVNIDLKSHFEDAMEQQNIEKHREKPLDLARRALRRLQGIPDDSEDLANPELEKVFSSIISRVNVLRKHAKTHRGPSAGTKGRKQSKKGSRRTKR